ncbi:Rv3235 family protein [Arcanobacterium buesumense]|uniref:Uncharacterized protein n=1 Tax=Arcanobacterium buesumense TaxID=2722751 RepID=A0A6H2EKV7_9ACTO|nr:Rv3235 family protein [Arcanobacterium buesumense]QJC21322.1 hypothetical protein HC352_01500 [Arcanobacterium buesumense]
MSSALTQPQLTAPITYRPVSSQTKPKFVASHAQNPTRKQSIPSASPSQPYDRIALCATSIQRISDDDDRHALDRPLPPDLIPATAFAARIVGHAIEILLGHRPVRQLQSWLAPGIYRSLVSRTSLNQRLQDPVPQAARPIIRRVHASHPRRRIAEVSVVVHDGFRIRAAALRLEIHRNHWIVTALEIA